MICSACGSSADGPTCDACGQSALLDGRYRLLSVLGQRGASKTYRAVEVESERPLVIKELLLRAAKSSKEIELFEREASLLEQIDDPGVPRFIDHFESRRGKQVGLYVVQEFVDGRSIEEELGARRFSEEEVAEVLASVLDVLSALAEHGIVHRDIKPSNILRAATGEIFLVDFGAGRAVAESIHRAGSTVTGTFGYMAPEQMRAEAVPATDVYGLGATAVRLLTRRDPGEFLGDDGRLHWRETADVSRELGGLVDAMLALDAEQRPADLDGLAKELRRFAAGGRGALAHYGRHVVVHQSAADLRRPSVGELASRLTVRVAPYLLFTIVAVFAAWSAAGIGYFDGMVLAGLFAVSGLFFSFLRLAQTVERWRLMRTGAPGRAVITARTIEQGDFKLELELRLADVRHTVVHPISEEMYLQFDEGDEIDIFFDPRRPERAALIDAGVAKISDHNRWSSGSSTPKGLPPE